MSRQEAVERDAVLKAEERERRLERERIEWVFGLTGGELEDEPWQIQEGAEGRKRKLRYWYEGLPEYAVADFSGESYRTVVCGREELLYGKAPEELVEADGTVWKLVASYRSSGEHECPCNEAPEKRPEGGCPLCEAPRDPDEVGYIYLGEGCGELIYECQGADEDEEPNDTPSWGSEREDFHNDG